jgi:hypothetical protein
LNSAAALAVGWNDLLGLWPNIGITLCGRVGERLKEHLPGAKDAIRGGEKVSIQQKSSISDALKAEARIIKSQQPSQNKKGK